MPDETATTPLGFLIEDALAKFRAQRDGRDDDGPETINIVETVTLRKYDHTPDVPVLVEVRELSRATRSVDLSEE